MTKSLLLLSVPAVLRLAGKAANKPAGNSAQANGTALADPAADEQAIRGQVDRWLQLVKAKDAATIAQLYTDDGAVMPPNGPIGKGHEAIEKTWASLMQTPGIELTFA